jgi:hypothetical protein
MRSGSRSSVRNSRQFLAFRSPHSGSDREWLTGVLAFLILALSADRLTAQQFTVQQPTISTFSVGTTVSVPDRGRAVSGGVGRGVSSRSTYGPFPMNSNYGSSFEGSSASVHAWIHDLSELDRQALDASGGQRNRSMEGKSDSTAASAYRTLTERPMGALPTSPVPGSRDRIRDVSARKMRGPETDERGSLSTDELYQRGMKAEAAGKRGVALAFLRLARDRGSEAAARELVIIEVQKKSESMRQGFGATSARTAGVHTDRAQGGSR